LMAGYSISCYFDANLLSGMYIGDWEAEISAYSQELERVKQYSAKAYLDMKQQVARNLIVNIDRPWYLIGEVYDESAMLPKHQQDGDLTALAYAHIYKLMLAFIFGDYTAALENVVPAEQYLQALSGMMPVPVFHFYAALTHLAHFPQQTESDRIATLDRVNMHQKAIELWAKDAPMNYQHKCYLIEAEKQRVLGNNDAAIEYYDRAIVGAKEHQFTQEEALANELAARFCLDRDRPQIAQTYLAEAYYCYERWGANAKSQQLIEMYPQLLASTSDSERVSNSLTEISTDLTVAAGSSEVLDLATLIEASQNIAKEVELDLLLLKFLNIIFTNAGADKCVLLLKDDNNLQEIASVECDTEARLLVPIPLESCLNVPISIVNRVDRSLQTLASGDEIEDCYYNEDAYFLHYQPTSFLCLPILHQGRSIGVIYLENQTTKSSFTPDRIKLIEILLSQAAISIENAKLYGRLQASVDLLEEKVAERTAELKAAKELAEANEREKTTLFNHINHELRSPLNAILGMSEGLLDCTHGELNPKQRRCVEVIENSGNHQLALINDILDYAKIEAGKLELYLEPTDIQNLCDESLSFVRFQADKKNLQLNLRVSPDLAPLVIDRRRINQVLINLLSNAVKFTPAGSISIEVTKLSNLTGIRICVIDTGIGIAAANLDRLFQPFAQIDSQEGRKSSGTGLGLNLAREIVALHGGRIQVTSEEGIGSQFIVDLPSGDILFQNPLPSRSARVYR
jgi:signal transduction histidine kinase